MGLDMYLTAILDISDSKIADLQTIFPEVERIESVNTTIGYWRKANAIHAWFVKNVQHGEDDCRLYNVYKDDIISLLDLVNDVIDKKQTPEQALPTTAGFFFGDTSYNEDYFQELDHTKKILEHALKLTENDWRFKYQSSW